MNSEKIFESMSELLNRMKENPEMVTEDDKTKLNKLYSLLCKATGTSEHIRWVIEWTVEKWHSMKEKMSGIAPYEVVRSNQNIVLDVGANEILKLITGAGTPYNNENAKIYVGTDPTAATAAQTGVIATGASRAFAGMDSGFPLVDKRTATFRTTFGEDAANFAWKEVSVTNGTGANSSAMNRKVADMGTKNGGVWSMQVRLNLVSA